MNNLKTLRDELGLNMNQAAKKLGLPYTTYVNYEKGEREPNSETLIMFADFYKTSVDYILGVPNASRNPYTTVLDKDSEQFLHMYSQLDNNDKAEIRGEMKHMLKADKYAVKSTKMA